MNLNKHTRHFADKIFQTYSENVNVYLRRSLTKGTNYNPKYNTDYTKLLQNPIVIKAVVRQEALDKLVIKDLGLVSIGAMTMLVRESDLNIVKLAEKLIIEGSEYEVYSSAVGKKILIDSGLFGYSRITIFRKGN
jgi:hypothetical protein